MPGDLALQNEKTAFCDDTPVVEPRGGGEVFFRGAFAALQAFEHRPSAAQFLREGFLVSHLWLSCRFIGCWSRGSIARRTDMRLADCRCRMERRALLAAHSASSAALLSLFAAEDRQRRGEETRGSGRDECGGS